MMQKLTKLTTRVLATLFAVFATSGAWAATLSSSGYISKDSANPTAVFSGVAITDIALGKYVLSGNIGGGNVNTDGEAGAYNYSVVAVDNVNSISSLTVQFQRIDDGYCKCVEVVFTESSPNVIKAYANRAGYKSGAALGGSSFDWYGTVVTDATSKGYGVYDLTLTLADRVPLAVWDGSKGDFKRAQRNNVTFDANGNTVPSDGSYVKITKSVGALFDLGAAYSYVVAEFTVTNLNETATANRVLALLSPNALANITADAASGNTTTLGVYLESGARTTHGIWESKTWSSSSSSIKSGVTLDSQRTFALTTEDSTFIAANDSRIGTHLFELTGDNPNSAIFGGAGNIGLRANQTYRLLSVGGLAKGSALAAFTDLVVTKVVIYASNHRQFTSGSSGIVDVSSVENPTTETVTNGQTITASSLNDEAPVCVYMEDGATLNLDTSLASSVYFFGSVAGDNNGLTLSDNGTVSATSASNLTPFGGSGTVIINNFTTQGSPSIDSGWTGTVWLKGTYSSANNNTRIANFDPSAYGTSSSIVKLTGIKCYFKSTAINYAGTIELADDGTTPALHVNDAYSVQDTFSKLTGSGTLKITDQKTAVNKILFSDASEFTGTFNISTRSVAIGSAPTSWSNGGQIYIAPGAEATVKANKTWVASAGMIVNGTLTVEAGAMVPTITTSSTAVYSLAASATIGTVSNKTLANQLFITAADATLTVNDTSIDELTIPADGAPNTYYNAGLLNLSGCTSLSKLFLELGVAKTFDMSKMTLPAGCLVYGKIGSVRDMSAYTTAISGVTYLVDETLAEYGRGSLTVENVPSGASVAVKRPDGTIVTASVDGSTATLSEPIKIDGAATYCDITFTNTVSMAYAKGNVVVRSPAANAANYNNDSADKTTGIMLYNTPWLGTSGQSGLNTMSDFQSSMTLAVVGQMPVAAKNADETKDNATIFIHLGGASGAKGFLIASSSEKDKVIVAYNNGNTATRLTTMTVPNATTARHAYVVTKSDDSVNNKSVFTIYLDGIKWQTAEVSPILNISGGVQVGSDFYGGLKGATQSDGTIYYAVTSGASTSQYMTDSTSYVNLIRIYDRILSQAEIDQYSIASEYPYVSPNGSANRTLTEVAEDWIQTSETDWTNTPASGDPTVSGTPTAGAALSLNASVESAVTVNLDADTSYEALTVNGLAATFVNGSAGKKVHITGVTTIGAVTTIEAGAVDISGAPVIITEDGSLTFDYSEFDLTSLSESPYVIDLTGSIDQNDAKISIVEPDVTQSTYELAYNNTTKKYQLTVTSAVTVTKNDTTVCYPTLAAAMAAAGGNSATITLHVNLSDDVTLAEGQSLELGSTTYTGVVYADTDCVVGLVNGVYTSYANTTGEEWTGAVDGNWNVAGNWSKGFVPIATTPITFSDDASVTLGSTTTVNGIAVNGSVTLSGGRELKTASNVTTENSGTLTLNDVCLTSMAAGITVAPPVNFTNDSELAGDYPLTLNGAVTISGQFKAWGGTGVNHNINGDVTINSGANFSSGNVWVYIYGDATVKGAFTTGNSKLKFCNGLTIEAGRVTANGSNVNVDSDTISVVLAGLGAEFEDARGEKIADSKVSTSVPHCDVKKSGSVYSVSKRGTIFSVY